MSNLYLVWHGQGRYPRCLRFLFGRGTSPGAALGEWFASQPIKFAASFCGEMRRQRQTADEVIAGNGRGSPGMVVDPGSEEFCWRITHAR